VVSGSETQVEVHPRIADIDAAQWDACANPSANEFNPFISHAFLKALEVARTTGGATGWHPQHLVVRDANDAIAATMPLYLKTHSQGEYVFDHAFANALTRAGGQYYPKLQAAVPFTPVPGARILVRPDLDFVSHTELLAEAALTLVEKLECSSLHMTFISEREWQALGQLGFLQRTDQQFHWHNRDYRCFEDFLADLASRKRKCIRKEREQALSGGVEIESFTGAAITEQHWDKFFQFYLDTSNRKWGRPYLNRTFFSRLGEAMADRCLLVMAKRHGQAIGGALNLIGGDCLYGRYWGATDPQACLHFEVCYYQAIDYAIAHKLARVEAGAQGEHKLARGYLPSTTYSVHWFREPGLQQAAAKFLSAEREQVSEMAEVLADAGPYRKVNG
jgi:uncharacterized protein